MKTVLDTTVLISATFWDGNESEIIRRAETGVIEADADCIISGDIHLLDLEEFEHIKIIRAWQFHERLCHKQARPPTIYQNT